MNNYSFRNHNEKTIKTRLFCEDELTLCSNGTDPYCSQHVNKFSYELTTLLHKVNI